VCSSSPLSSPSLVIGSVLATCIPASARVGVHSFGFRLNLRYGNRTPRTFT
jgi:hypothetical protein